MVANKLQSSIFINIYIYIYIYIEDVAQATKRTNIRNKKLMGGYYLVSYVSS